MERSERRKLELRLEDLLQIQGELKRKEKDLATKVICSTCSRVVYNYVEHQFPRTLSLFFIILTCMAQRLAG
jgi:hypothetical protein